jgi:hypothetical protein
MCLNGGNNSIGLMKMCNMVILDQGKGKSLDIVAIEHKMDEAFDLIWNLQSSLDIVFSMQKTLFERLCVGLHSNIDQQALKPVHKSHVHNGLQLETLVTLENVMGEVDGG